LDILPGFIAIVNDPAMTALVCQVGADLLGEESVEEARLEMGAEDFSYFAREAPGCFFELGAAFPDEPLRRHHHPNFDIDERCLPIGAALLAETAIRFLGGVEGE
jgi:amidohydrolase